MNKNLKYSLIEIERKWTVNKDKLPDISKLPLIGVTDKYFPDTRTRLRMMHYIETGEILYKLTKKYGKISAQSEPLTTLYLTKYEYDLFNKLKGNILVKNIYRYLFNGNIFLIEIFKKPKVDFILLETESTSEKEINEVAIPDFVIDDVTNVIEYEGYTIAEMNS